MNPRRVSTLLFATWLCASAAQGCAPTETGNPPQGTVQLGLTAFSTAPEVADLSSGQGGLVVDRFRLNVVGLSLQPCSSGSAPLEADPGSYDVLAGSVTAALMGDAVLCSLSMDLGPGDPEPSVYIHGQRTDGSEFEVVSNELRTLTLVAAAGDSFGTRPLILGFNLGVWFTEVDVHGAHAGADGVARLDTVLNPSLLAAFEARASLAAALYEDTNGDGHLQDPEATAVATTK